LYSLFSVSCFLTFFISGLTSFVFEILKLSTLGSAVVSVILTAFFALVNLGVTFLTTFLIFFEIIFLAFLTFLALTTFFLETFFFHFFVCFAFKDFL